MIGARARRRRELSNGADRGLQVAQGIGVRLQLLHLAVKIVVKRTIEGRGVALFELVLVQLGKQSAHVVQQLVYPREVNQ